MPSAVPQRLFGPFRLDPANGCLWRGSEAITLVPKAFDVLRYLHSSSSWARIGPWRRLCASIPYVP
jgi:hypothetical protein